MGHGNPWVPGQPETPKDPGNKPQPPPQPDKK